MEDNFWKGKTVLITGHTGFKGSWLSLWLQRKGASVVGYSLAAPTKPSLFEVARVAQGMISITGDVRDLKHLKTVFNKYSPEIIIHLAAQPIVRYSYNHPVDTYSTNIMGTVSVLEAVRFSESVKVALIITSDKCYENKEWVWGYRENDPMGGYDPYSSSKGCAELVVAAYRKSFFSGNVDRKHCTAVASTRAGNVVGGGDWAKDRLIPDIMKAFMNDQEVIIRYPNAIRPWQHVLEPLRGYLMLAEKLWNNGEKFCGGWNFGPDDKYSKPVSWVADCLTKHWGGNVSWKTDSTIQPHEDTYLKLDSTKAKNLLGWSPKIKLNTTLQWIVEWYRAYFKKENMRQVTETEILRYEQILNEQLLKNDNAL
jgi:CDP-glucose 4,6-dehydratase